MLLNLFYGSGIICTEILLNITVQLLSLSFFFLNSLLSDPMWHTLCCCTRSELASHFTPICMASSRGKCCCLLQRCHDTNAHKDTNSRIIQSMHEALWLFLFPGSLWFIFVCLLVSHVASSLDSCASFNTFLKQSPLFRFCNQIYTNISFNAWSLSVCLWIPGIAFTILC